MFGAVNFCNGEELTVHFIYMPGFLVINKVTSSKIDANCFGAGYKLVACLTHPGDSTFLIITEWRTCLTWLRQQPTQTHLFSLKVDVLSIKKITLISTVLFYTPLNIFSCARRM